RSKTKPSSCSCAAGRRRGRRSASTIALPFRSFAGESPSMLRQLVVNADDLGLTTAVNDGILDAHELGILTSASLFASAPATDDAIRRVRTRPSLGVGVHLTLVDGTPTLPAHLVPSLVTGDGRFRPSWQPFIVACLQGRVSLGEVERELTAQIQRL